MAEDLPRLFGHYQLRERLGGGDLTGVFLARNTRARNRWVVVKRLPLMDLDPRDAQRIRAEAESWIEVGDHPHIVSLFNFCDIDEHFVLEMEHVPGNDLASVLVPGAPLSPRRAVRVVTQIASALHQVHEKGLLHRDVKPPNILLQRPDAADRDDEVHAVLADFGIARREAPTQALTTGDAPLGTYQYMAPERHEPTPSDRRADVYSLACVLFECLTGCKAFAQDKRIDVLNAQQAADLPTLASFDHRLTPFDDLVLGALAVDRDERPADAHAFKELAWAALAAYEASLVHRGTAPPLVDATSPPPPGPPAGHGAAPSSSAPSSSAPPSPHGSRLVRYALSPVNAVGLGAGGVAFGAVTAFDAAGPVPALVGLLLYGTGAAFASATGASTGAPSGSPSSAPSRSGSG